MGELQGKVAIVTGAGRGLGRAHALALAAAGAAIVVNDVGSGIDGSGRSDPGPALDVVREITARGGRAIANGEDVSDWGAAARIIDAAWETFGRLDVLVNNAGVTRFATIETETGQGWRKVIGVNLDGTAALTHWAALRWRRAGAEPGRAIVNTASPAGTHPAPGAAAYCASKAAVIALTISSAGELAELGVRVNAIAPMARTRMTDFAALAETMKPVEQGFDRVAPENVAQVVRYLASPACRFTGRVFGTEGDDVYLFDGFSAEGHANNRGAAWTVDGLAAALADFDRQDRGFMIAPSLRVPAAAPSDAVFEALDAVARGEPAHVWNPLTG